MGACEQASRPLLGPTAPRSRGDRWTIAAKGPVMREPHASPNEHPVTPWGSLGLPCSPPSPPCPQRRPVAAGS
eukprot:9475666-Pyramimonas_sp.AAC.1